MKDRIDKINKIYEEAFDSPIPDNIADVLKERVAEVLEGLPAELEAELIKQATHGKVAVKYIGHRAQYKDNCCGSKLVFLHGQTLLVPEQYALKMLKHSQVYEQGDGETALDVVCEAVEDKKEDDDKELDNSYIEADIRQMTRKAPLVDFIRENFSIEVSPDGKKVAELQDRAIQLMHQVGLPE